MDTNQTATPARQATITGLAAVGFIALVAAGIWLAIYSTRYVPTVVNRVGGAAVYLGSLFVPASEPGLSVIPAASTTPSENGTGTSTVPGATTKPPAQTIPVAGQQTSNTYQIGGATTTRPFSGLPDLVTRINAVGYLATTSAESFVASTTVPAGKRPAVNFTVENIGTNASGPWRFSATIPAQTVFLFMSQPQQSLAPGDRIDYTLGFDQANRGPGQLISITANFDRTIGESNTNNNSASAQLTILGS